MYRIQFIQDQMHLIKKTSDSFKIFVIILKLIIRSAIEEWNIMFQTLQTPWKEIFTSQPMWALIIVHCGQNWGFWMLLTEMPTYMSKVVGFSIKEVSMLRTSRACNERKEKCPITTLINERTQTE